MKFYNLESFADKTSVKVSQANLKILNNSYITNEL